MALEDIIRGQFLYEIKLIDKEREMKDKYKLNGRQIAWLIRQKFIIAGVVTNSITHYKLHTLVLEGDNVAKYLNKFDVLMLDLEVGAITEETKEHLFSEQISRSVQLKEITDRYEIETQKGTAQRSYAELRAEVDLHFVVKRRIATTKKFKQGSTGVAYNASGNTTQTKGQSKGTSGKGKCYQWANFGECKRSNCAFVHPEAERGSGKGKKGKGKGKKNKKGKGKGKSSSSGNTEHQQGDANAAYAGKWEWLHQEWLQQKGGK